MVVRKDTDLNDANKVLGFLSLHLSYSDFFTTTIESLSYRLSHTHGKDV